MYFFEVKKAASLLTYLFECFPKIPRTRVKKWLHLQCVSVNGNTVTQHDFSLSPQNRVEVFPGKKVLLAKKSSIKIIYQDDCLFVIEKPAGLLTIATEKIKTKTAYFELNDLLQSSTPGDDWLSQPARRAAIKKSRPGDGWTIHSSDRRATIKKSQPGRRERAFIVHRLDRETSGLLVFARTEEIKHKLQKEWEKVEKHYYAVVEGVPAMKEGILRSHLAQNAILRVYSTEENEHTKLAITHYRLIKSNGKFSLLDVMPKTGRKNQIRVQLADIGHPIAGDKKYGSTKNPAGRLALHAYRLSFTHPLTGKPMTFKCDLPQVLASIIK